MERRGNHLKGEERWVEWIRLTHLDCCEDLNEQCDITSVCHRLEASNKKELQKEEKKKREQGNREEKGRMTVCEHLNEKSGVGNER